VVTELTGGGKAWYWWCQTSAQRDSRLAIEREKRGGKGRQRKAAKFFLFLEADGRDETRRTSDRKKMTGKEKKEARRRRIKEKERESEKRR